MTQGLFRGAMAIAFLALAGEASTAAAPLSSEERALLENAVSRDGAVECGRTGNARCLERIIGLHDRMLALNFDEGMNRARMSVLPPEVEGVVVAHFDDPTLGEVLRGFGPRYRTRALFDLHYARVKKAYRNDEPSMRQVLKTELPGIEPLIFAMAGKYPSMPGYPNPALAFLGARHYPDAVAPLLAALAQSYRDLQPGRHNPILGLLLDYPSPEVWRRARDEVERLHRAGSIDSAAYALSLSRIEPLLAAPDANLERMRQRQADEAYRRRKLGIYPGESQLYELRDQPREYVPATLAFLAQLEPIAAESGLPASRHDLVYRYVSVGLVERFELGQPAAAIASLEKAAEHGDALARMAIADTYQLALHDRARAIAEYRKALAEASKPAALRVEGDYGAAGSAINAWWRDWLAVEIRFLETGERFHGRITEPALAGCFDAFKRYSGQSNALFLKGLPYIPRQPALMGGTVPGENWKKFSSALARLDRGPIRAKLDALPSSRMALFATMGHASLLPDAESIARYLGRNDPSGYWSSCLLDAAQRFPSGSEVEKREAVSRGVLYVLPGLALPAESNALATAAASFVKSR